MTKYSTSSFRDTAAGLTALESWLTGLGIRVAPSRVGFYQREMQKLITAQEAGTLEKEFSKPELRAMLLTFAEITELEFIREHLAGRWDSLFKKSIEDAVSGPNLSRQENAARSSNWPRNTLFELTVAANLAAAGFDLSAFGQCDVVTEFEGKRVLIECKRPQFDHQVNSAIKGGMEQLAKRLPEQGAIGLLALSISKLISDGQRILIAANQTGVDIGIDETAQGFIRRHKAAWNAKASAGVAGVMVHFGVSGIARDNDRLHVGKKYYLCPMESALHETVDLLRRFHEKFCTATIHGAGEH